MNNKRQSWDEWLREGLEKGFVTSEEAGLMAVEHNGLILKKGVGGIIVETLRK